MSPTFLRSVSPPGHQAAVCVCYGVGWRGQAHRLDQRPEGGRPGPLQLQKGDVIVKSVRIVVLMHHNPLDLCNVFGTALRQHAEVSTPGARVREAAGTQVRGHFTSSGEATLYAKTHRETVLLHQRWGRLTFLFWSSGQLRRANQRRGQKRHSTSCLQSEGWPAKATPPRES